MTFFQSRIMIASAVSLLTLSACNPTNNQKAADVAATVNGIAISKSRVDMMVKQGLAEGQPDTPDLRKKIIDQLSMQLLISQEAIKKGINRKPEISEQLELARQTILANAFVQDYLESNPISDDMVKDEYEKIKGQMSGKEYKARHILVEKEAEAKEIIAKLRKDPKGFESLAKERSKDFGSKVKGGDLGWFDPRAMVPEFGSAVENLTEGNFSEVPVRTNFGFHVILLEDSRAKIIPPLDQVKSSLQQQLQQQNMKKLFDDLKAKAKIKITQAAIPEILPAKESMPEASQPDEQSK